MNKILPSLCVICLFVISCQKELSGDYGIPSPGGGNGGGSGAAPAALLGTWKFVGMSSTGYTETVVNAGGIDMKTSSRYAFNTIQNTGTMQFEKTRIVSTNLGYAVDTTLWQVTYMDGTLMDSSEMPMYIPYFSSSSTTDYKMKGTDSISLTNGSLPGSQNSVMGIKITGNQLKLSVRILRDSVISAAGAIGRLRNDQMNYMNFVKQ